MNKTNLLGYFRNMLRLPFVLFVVALVGSCGARHRSFIFIIDLSQSVSDSAKTQAFETIKNQAKLLKRGDSITVIPLTGDAITETSGKVIRLQVAQKREAFDNDLRKFFAEVEQKLTKMYSEAQNYNNTDIFGALRVAHDEISLTDRNHRQVFLIVLSDMVNSTPEIRFEQNGIFENPYRAKQYAEKLMAGKEEEWRIDGIYLGILESTDLQSMRNARREAIREFWQQFFLRSGVERYQYATDGTGQLSQFVDFNKNG